MHAFAAIRKDGTVTGHASKQWALWQLVYQDACLRSGLSGFPLSKVVTWGRVDAGGDSSAVQTQLTGVREHLQSRADGCADFQFDYWRQPRLRGEA